MNVLRCVYKLMIIDRSISMYLFFYFLILKTNLMPFIVEQN